MSLPLLQKKKKKEPCVGSCSQYAESHQTGTVSLTERQCQSPRPTCPVEAFGCPRRTASTGGVPHRPLLSQTAP